MATHSAPGHTGPNRVAFYGRCASEQDAPVSLERQLHTVSAALPAHAWISRHFVDVGVWNSSREGLTRSGWRLDGHLVLGGRKELLRRAHDADCTFDVLVCVNDSRWPRRVAERLAVEEDLAECGVGIATPSTGTADLLEDQSMQRAYWLRLLGDWGTTGVERFDATPHSPERRAARRLLRGSRR